MQWVLLSILAHVFYAISNTFDKVLREKYIKDDIVLSMFIGVFALLALIVIPFRGFIMPDLKSSVIIVLGGALYLLSMLPYFKALESEEVSNVNIFMRMYPLFILIFAIIFLNERLDINKSIAFFLLFCGSILLSVKKTKGLFKISSSFLLILVATILWAIYFTLLKHFYTMLQFWDVFILSGIGSFIGSLLLFLFKNYRKRFVQTIKSLKKQSAFILVLKSVLGFLGALILNFAITLGPVSLVTVIGGFQPLFVLLFAIMLSYWFPDMLKEDISKKILGLKLLAIFLTILGLVFLYL